MDKKSLLLMFVVFTVFIISLGGISAAGNESNISNNSNTDMQSQTLTDNQSDILTNINDSSIKTDIHVSDNSSDEFIDAINNGNNTVIFLDNQTFDLNSTLLIRNMNLTFYGGHAFGDGQTATLLSTSKLYSYGSNITFIGINLIDTSANIGEYDSFSFSDGNLSFINCTLSNNANRINVYPKGFFMENCTVKNDYIEISNAISPLVRNCTFENSTLYFDSLRPGSIVNSTFYNSDNKTALHVVRNTKVDNCTFYNNTGLDTLNSEYANCITNCNFFNNTNDYGVVSLGNMYYPGEYYVNDLINCSFYNNTAIYGGGIYSYTPQNVTVDNCSFINNYALISGGAISSEGNFTVNNSIFINNTAGVCGGAITIGNSTENTISNCNFTDNNANDYGNDIYYYDGNITLNNTNLTNVYNAENNTLTIYDQLADTNFVVYPDENITGFCLEERLLFPGYRHGNVFSTFNNTNLAINTVYDEPVGNYIKYLLVNYYGKEPIELLNYAIWIFTDEEFKDPNLLNNIDFNYLENIFNKIKNSKVTFDPYGVSRNDILAMSIVGYPYDLNIQDLINVLNNTINGVNSGVYIPDHNYTVDNHDGTVTVYDFNSIFSNTYQNFLTIKTSNITAVYDMNVTKITNNLTVIKGQDTSFDILITNNGTVTLYNITLTEDSFGDLTYKTWSSVSGNWTYDLINNKHTWILNDPLSVGCSTSITVVFSTENSTAGEKVNTVIVSNNETVNKTAINTTEVIVNNTQDTPTNNTTNQTDNNTPKNQNNVIQNNESGNIQRFLQSNETSNNQKLDVKTKETTGYPLVPFIISLIGIMAMGFRRR